MFDLMTTLVTGGAGYIGAHVIRLLENKNESVVVVDDLSTGAKDRIGSAGIVELNLSQSGASAKLAELIEEHKVEQVIHFAARKQVGESVARPAYYYEQNVTGMNNLLQAMEQTGCKKLVFSSSAATYGMPDVPLVREDLTPNPINPYGETKLIGEWMGAAAAKAWGLKFVALRYFNVAGAGWSDLADPAILNLVPMVLDKWEQGQSARIFGEDYPTSDGTCIRDYIHVLDLADAHIASLDYLNDDARPYDVFNVGTGAGSSVKEVIDGLRAVSGIEIPNIVESRRAGDPPQLIGDTTRINEVLNWHAKAGLAEILQSAWDGWQAGPRRIRF